MSFLIGRGRSARETYPQSPGAAGGGGGVGGSVLVLQQGGKPGGNVYVSWGALAAVAQLQSGPIIIAFDNTFAQCHLTAGEVTLQNVTFTLVSPLSNITTIVVDQGAVLNVSTLEVNSSVNFQAPASATTSWITIVAGLTFMRVAEGAQLESQSATPLISVTGGTLSGYVTEHGQLGDSGGHVCISNTGGTVSIRAFDQAVIKPNALVGAVSVTATPGVTLNGQPATFAGLEGQIAHTTVSKTAAYVLNSGATPDYRVWANTASGAFPITLPPPALGLEFEIVDSGNDFATNNLTLTRHGGETINGASANLPLVTSGAAYRITTDGVNWWVNKSVAGG